jgi:hypothetical protein
MAKINQMLLRRLQKELNVGKRRVYEMIQRKMTETHLDRHLAAIVLASEHNINIAKYAKSEELAIIRGGIISSNSHNAIIYCHPPSCKEGNQVNRTYHA